MTNTYNVNEAEQENFVDIIHQVREANVTSVLDLETQNPLLYASFTKALTNFVMHPSSKSKTVLTDLQDILGIAPEVALRSVNSWLYESLTSKSKKAGRLRVDNVILDKSECRAIRILHLTITNRLKDLLKEKEALLQRESRLFPIDHPVSADNGKHADANALSLSEVISDSTQMIENCSSLFKDTTPADTILSANLRPEEKLCLFALALGYSMPRSIKAFAQDVSSEALQSTLRDTWPSRQFKDFPFEEALSVLRKSSIEEIGELKHNGRRILAKDKKFHEYLRKCCL